MLTRSLIVLSSLLVAGCSLFEALPPEEAVRQRADAQAQALIAQDYEKALSYVSPAYQNGPRAKSYRARFDGASMWKRAEVAWVRCDEMPEPDRCEVRLWVYGAMPHFGGPVDQRGDTVPISLNSVWIQVDGKWYQYLD